MIKNFFLSAISKKSLLINTKVAQKNKLIYFF